MSLRHFGQPKVENLSVPALRNEDVRGLDVAMDDARGVRGVQCVRHLEFCVLRSRILRGFKEDKARGARLVPRGANVHPVGVTL